MACTTVTLPCKYEEGGAAAHGPELQLIRDQHCTSPVLELKLNDFSSFMHQAPQGQQPATLQSHSTLVSVNPVIAAAVAF